MSKEELVRLVTASRTAAVGLQNQLASTRAQAPTPSPSSFTSDELLRLRSLISDPAPFRQPPPGHITVDHSSGLIQTGLKLPMPCLSANPSPGVFRKFLSSYFGWMTLNTPAEYVSALTQSVPTRSVTEATYQHAALALLKQAVQQCQPASDLLQTIDTHAPLPAARAYEELCSLLDVNGLPGLMLATSDLVAGQRQDEDLRSYALRIKTAAAAIQDELPDDEHLPDSFLAALGLVNMSDTYDSVRQNVSSNHTTSFPAFKDVCKILNNEANSRRAASAMRQRQQPQQQQQRARLITDPNESATNFQANAAIGMSRACRHCTAQGIKGADAMHWDNKCPHVFPRTR